MRFVQSAVVQLLLFLPRQIRAEYGSLKRGFILFAESQASN
jgi:hypothetical protein